MRGSWGLITLIQWKATGIFLSSTTVFNILNWLLSELTLFKFFLRKILQILFICLVHVIVLYQKELLVSKWCNFVFLPRLITVFRSFFLIFFFFVVSPRIWLRGVCCILTLLLNVMEWFIWQIRESCFVPSPFYLWAFSSKHCCYLHQRGYDGRGHGQCSCCSPLSAWSP